MLLYYAARGEGREEGNRGQQIARRSESQGHTQDAGSTFPSLGFFKSLSVPSGPKAQSRPKARSKEKDQLILLSSAQSIEIGRNWTEAGEQRPKGQKRTLCAGAKHTTNKQSNKEEKVTKVPKWVHCHCLALGLAVICS